MLFQCLVNKIPFVGNLVPVRYIRQNSLTKKSTVVNANSVRLFSDNKFIRTGLIVTDAELTEAHSRFIKYVYRIGNDAKGLPVGQMCLHHRVQTYRAGSPYVNGNVVFLFKDGCRLGYIFADSELATIISRTDKLIKVVRFPKWYHKALLWINHLT